MCLAIPGKITEISDDRTVATVDFGDLKKQVRLDLLFGEDVKPGSSVLVHVGYAIQLISPDEAEETARLFDELADVMEMDN
ncbi:MAG: HypC/HybG/HupF family hydrogenase formation chaperone [Methanosarcinaceae archaeon]|nr:HypC/HybG/HupF family hydrogenase formation chaperone [Methanosarcinaceae archaeon]